MPDREQSYKNLSIRLNSYETKKSLNSCRRNKTSMAGGKLLGVITGIFLLIVGLYLLGTILTLSPTESATQVIFLILSAAAVAGGIGLLYEYTR